MRGVDGDGARGQSGERCRLGAIAEVQLSLQAVVVVVVVVLLLLLSVGIADCAAIQTLSRRGERARSERSRQRAVELASTTTTAVEREQADSPALHNTSR